MDKMHTCMQHYERLLVHDRMNTDTVARQPLTLRGGRKREFLHGVNMQFSHCWSWELVEIVTVARHYLMYR